MSKPKVVAKFEMRANGIDWCWDIERGVWAPKPPRVERKNSADCPYFFVPPWNWEMIADAETEWVEVVWGSQS